MIINLDTRSYKSNSKWLIKNGQCINGFVLPEEPITMDQIAILYKDYKYSYPNPNIRKPYFKALPANQLTMDQMVNNKTRNQTKNELEKTLLFAILRGDIVWPDEKLWFWQPLKDKDFVLLKRWFIPKEA